MKFLLQTLVCGMVSIFLLCACDRNDDNELSSAYSDSSTETIATAVNSELVGEPLKKPSSQQAQMATSNEPDKLLASSALAQANSFKDIYSTTCGKSLGSFDELRNKLASLQKLPDGQAQRFLNGQSGVAYPVPDDYGTFVLALFDDLPMCAVFARELNGKIATQQFIEMFADAPDPLVARQVDLKQSPKEFQKTTAYAWTTPEADNEMLFVLSTSKGLDTGVQGLFTATLSQKE